jgi:hypothetical protein
MSELNLVGESKNDYAFSEDRLDPYWTVNLYEKSTDDVNEFVIDRVRTMSEHRIRDNKFFKIINKNLHEIYNRSASWSSINRT